MTPQGHNETQRKSSGQPEEPRAARRAQGKDDMGPRMSPLQYRGPNWPARGPAGQPPRVPTHQEWSVARDSDPVNQGLLLQQAKGAPRWGVQPQGLLEDLRKHRAHQQRGQRVQGARSTSPAQGPRHTHSPGLSPEAQDAGFPVMPNSWRDPWRNRPRGEGALQRQSRDPKPGLFYPREPGPAAPVRPAGLVGLLLEGSPGSWTQAQWRSGAPHQGPLSSLSCMEGLPGSPSALMSLVWGQLGPQEA